MVEELRLSEEEYKILTEQYDPFSEIRTTVKIRRGGTWYPVSVIDTGLETKYDWTIICVHGWGSNALIYRFLIYSLSSYFRIIAYDLKGHGESDKGEDTYDLGLYTEELAQIIDHYNPQNLVLIGHSMGTAIVMNYLFYNPKRAKVAIISSGSADFREPLPRIVPLFISKMDERVKNALVELGVTMNVTKDCPKELVELIREQNKKAPYFVYRNALLNTIYAWKRDEELANIKIPVLLVVGDKDLLTPPHHAERLHELLPNSHLVIIKDAGHSIMIEKGMEVASLVKDFVEYQIDLEMAKKEDMQAFIR